MKMGIYHSPSAEAYSPWGPMPMPARTIQAANSSLLGGDVECASSRPFVRYTPNVAKDRKHDVPKSRG